jgi:hypothetical protein
MDAADFELLEQGMIRIQSENHLIDMNKLDYSRNMKDNNRSKFFNSFKSMAFPSYLDPILSMDQLATQLGAINGR